MGSKTDSLIALLFAVFIINSMTVYFLINNCFFFKLEGSFFGHSSKGILELQN